MSQIATLMRRMAEAGAPIEAITIAVEALEAMQGQLLDGLDASAVRVNSHGRVVRRRIPDRLRRAVFARDGETCRYCATKDGPFHLDHVVPVYLGGAHTLNNLVVACGPCNMAKGATAPEEWEGRACH